jgi:hypothetical protein
VGLEGRQMVVAGGVTGTVAGDPVVGADVARLAEVASPPLRRARDRPLAAASGLGSGPAGPRRPAGGPGPAAGRRPAPQRPVTSRAKVSKALT